jgi:MFS family permease
VATPLKRHHPPHSRDPAIERSLQHSLRDGRAWAFMSGIGETWFSAFAILFKASTQQIALLTSLPLVAASLFQWLSVWLGRQGVSRRRVIITGALGQALSWLLILLLPILFPSLGVELLIVAIILFHALGNLVAPQWSSLMGDLVPERRRGRFFARRTRIATLASFIGMIAGGLLLEASRRLEEELWGFAAIFLLALLARLISTWHLAQMHDPRHTEVAPSISAVATPIPHAFWHFSLLFALMQFAVAISSPFFALYMLRDLEFSYAILTLMVASSVMAQFLTLHGWGRLSDAYGNRLILVTTALLIPVMPAMWLISTDIIFLVILHLIGGLIWAGYSLSCGNFLYDLSPADRRADLMATHTLLANSGVMAGALLGGWLGEWAPSVWQWGDYSVTWLSGLPALFLLSASVRMVIALLYLRIVKEVREVAPLSVGQLIFRVTRFNALNGIVYQVVGRLRPKKSKRERG